jgi:predicted transcriptional regulator
MEIRELEKSAQVRIQLSQKLNRQLDRAARKSGVSKSAYMRVALERELSLEKQLARDYGRKR